MERVHKYLNQLVQSQRFGGRIVARDERTLIVFDTPSWGERECKAIRSKFPECSVEVHAFDGSLSGFIVLITRHTEPWTLASESLYVACALALGWTVYWLHCHLRTQELA
jgi:hypothetical protein